MAQNNILVLASTFPRSNNDVGMPSFVYELERRIAKKKNIVILAPHFAGAAHYEKIDGMHVHRFSYMWPYRLQRLSYGSGILGNLKKNPFLFILIIPFFIFQFIAVVRLCQKYHIQGIHAHWIIPQAFTAVLYKKIFRKKNIYIVCSILGGDLYALQVFNLLKRFILNSVDAIIVMTDQMRKEILHIGVCHTRIYTIPMGENNFIFHPSAVDMLLRERYDIQGPFILFVGRLVEKKGATYLLDAFPAVLEKFPMAKLVVIGQGYLYKSLCEQVRALRIENNVLFIGNIALEKLPAYFATADLFVGPSIIARNGDREGLLLTCIEAMMSGCPVVVSSRVPASEYVVEGINGYVVPEKNPQLLAEKIIASLTPPFLEKQGIVDSVTHIFSWDVIVKKHYLLFESLEQLTKGV